MAWESSNPACDNLYVKGLPDEFDSEGVNQFFSACGTVLSAKSLGVGVALVRFSTVEEATMVKDAMNGQQPMGCNQPITMSYSTSKGGAGKDSGKGAGVQMAFQTQVFGKAGAPKGGGDWNSPYGGGKGKGGFRKSKLCNNFEQGWCPRGEACTFAHGEHELGTPQPGQEDLGGAWNPAVVGGKGKAGPTDASEIKGLVDGLMKEGLPGSNLPKDTNALYVTNLPWDTTELDLYTVFAAFGAIPPRGCRVMPASEPGARLYAFVNFMELQNAEFAATCLNGVLQPDGAKMFVKAKR